MMNALLRTEGQDARSIANSLGIIASGILLSSCRVYSHLISSLERPTKLFTNTRAHNVESVGTVVGRKLRRDDADNEGVLL